MRFQLAGAEALLAIETTVATIRSRDPGEMSLGSEYVLVEIYIQSNEERPCLHAAARSARRARPLKRTALLAKPMNGINAPQRPDCVAGVGGLELRNVVAKYPFERSDRFPGTQPNFGHRDLFAFELRR